MTSQDPPVIPPPASAGPASTPQAASTTTGTSQPTILYDDFAKVQLRVATILEASPVEKSKKLMRLQIDLGSERRQILAGIKEHYSAEQLAGRQIIVVANLAPREVIKGEASNGMLLAASDPVSGKVIILSPSDPTSPGSKVS
jgi:methionyl-tRNA synthetase